MRKPSTLTNDPGEERARQEGVKSQRDLELEDLKELIQIPAGVRFFKRMCVDASIFTTTFTGNSHTFFLEGKRDLALRYLRDIGEVRPDIFTKIILKEEKDG